ncbi:MAG TPA: hypothetical protein VEU54_04550 [Steroidobacteraceae bacterium]|jgi:Zn finger protein HypA/HybF involved in hydrogenase expression|nr:hypothetical protein [Steroidobacteraceae bacterium]
MTDLNQAISQALMLATRLRAMSERTKDSPFKGVVAELLLELAEVQIKIDELVSEHNALKERLQAQSAPHVERCPRCHELGWRVTGRRQVKNPGQPPRIAQSYACSKCGLKEEVLTGAE